MTESIDVVIVGGGIAGAALASAVARDGLGVVVLEASEQYEDRVRGESMVPWGVAEARELGVEQCLLESDARITGTWVHYDDAVPTDVTLARPIPAGMIVPGVDGSLNLRHPEACAGLARLAISNGARVVRGVRDVAVTAGTHPTVTAQTAMGEQLSFSPRLVIGADGRNSTVRRQVGIDLDRHEATHMVAGVIVDGLEVEVEHDFLASNDELFMASFRQHDGQMRVYLCPGLAQKNRFAGPTGMAEFLRSANFACLPFGEALANANPIGPLATYPGDDTWTATPYVPGVVLVGDAAGWNTPIIGQGLSIAMRDVRLVRDALRTGDMSPSSFRAYADERLERMRRLRNASMVMAAAMADDCDNRIARRAKFFELQETEPLMLAMMIGLFGGPENAPPEAFDGRLRELIQAA